MQHQTVEPLHRDAIITNVAQILNLGESSKWEFEGACLAGLRSHRCLAGHEWHAADKWAAKVVAHALARIGASIRPTWQQGQPDFVEGMDGLIDRRRCVTCGGRIDDDSRRLYCSDECNRTAATRRMAARLYKEAEAARLAFYAARAAGEVATRTCSHCEREFAITVKHPWTRFCSQGCYQNDRRIAGRDCEQCGKHFKPVYRLYKYCSTDCYHESRRRTRASRQCDHCGSTFTPRNDGARESKRRFCSKSCASRRRCAAA